MKDDRVVTWRGQPVDGMDRDQLMEAFQDVSRLYRDALAKPDRFVHSLTPKPELRQ